MADMMVVAFEGADDNSEDDILQAGIYDDGLVSLCDESNIGSHLRRSGVNAASSGPFFLAEATTHSFRNIYGGEEGGEGGGGLEISIATAWGTT